MNKFETAAMINEILKEYVDNFAGIDGIHDTDNMSFTWSISDDYIDLKIKSYNYRNTSCSCHPEYNLEDLETYHSILISELEDMIQSYEASGDTFNDRYIDYIMIGNSLTLQAYREKIAEDKKREKEEKERQAKLEKERQEKARIKREKDEYERLNKLYGKGE